MIFILSSYKRTLVHKIKSNQFKYFKPLLVMIIVIIGVRLINDSSSTLYANEYTDEGIPYVSLQDISNVDSLDIISGIAVMVPDNTPPPDYSNIEFIFDIEPEITSEPEIHTQTEVVNPTGLELHTDTQSVTEADVETTIQTETELEVIIEAEPEIGIQNEIDLRSLPIYEVYKWGYPVSVSPVHQWFIRDTAEKYGYDEKFIFGLILIESTFDANAGENNAHSGWAQVSKYWISDSATKAGVPRYTDDYASRNMCDPYDNLITCIEIWDYAVDKYNIDLSTDLGYVKLAYWHNTGKTPTNVTQWKYSTLIMDVKEELIEIEY